MKTQSSAARPDGHRDEAEGDRGARCDGADGIAGRLLFHRIAVDQAFPLELKVPNADDAQGHQRSTRW